MPRRTDADRARRRDLADTAAGIPPAEATAPTEATLAFIYDRHATPTPGPLEDRLTRCRTYAKNQGWTVAGEWIDRDDDALIDDRRPQWYALVRAMKRARPAPAVCLVASWERISRTAPNCGAALRSHIGQAGGYCVTADGETDQWPWPSRGRLGAPLDFGGSL